MYTCRHVRAGNKKTKYLVLRENRIDRIVVVFHEIKIRAARLDAIGPASHQELPTLSNNPLDMLGALSLRYAAKSLVLSRTLRHQYRPTPHRDANGFRRFSTTPRRLASEDPDDFINAIKHTALFKKLADKPNALKALSDLYALTKEMGAGF